MSKNLLLYLSLIFFVILRSITFAETKNIIVKWEMKDTTNITGYQVYYSYYSDMKNNIQCGEIYDPLANVIECTNADINRYPIYLTVTATSQFGDTFVSNVRKIIEGPINLRIVK